MAALHWKQGLLCDKMQVTTVSSFPHDIFYPIKERKYHLSYIYFVVLYKLLTWLRHIFVIW